MKKKLIYTLAGFFLLLLLLTLASNTMLTTSAYDLSYKDLPAAFDGFRIVLLSDLHSKQFGSNNQRLLHSVAAAQPDLIALTGDMVDSADEDFSVFLDLAKNLSNKYPVYYVAGNHEQSLGESKLSALYQMLETAGVIILDNEKITLTREGQGVDVYGLWYNLRYYSDQSDHYIQEHAETYYFSTAKITSVLGEAPSGSFRLLLTHNPVYFDTYSSWGADLTLCGHIHGGMVRLPLIGGVYSPERTFFPQYDAGLFSSGEKNMLVSRGLGNGRLGFRFLNPPELVSVTLRRN